MKRVLLPASALALLFLAACGSGHAQGSYVIDYRPHAPRSSVTPLANRRERLAGRKAEALLRRVPLPPGAVRLPPPAPSDRLAQSGLGVSTVNMTADRYAVWRVPGSGPSVIAYEKRHMLSGFRSVGLGSSPDGWRGDEFDGPIVNGILRWAVSVIVVPEGGQTRLRLDAGVAWIYPRSPSEAVPSGVREIDVHGGGVARRVTAARKVARIVRWFDALDASQPGPAVVGCIAVIGSDVTFVFRSASGARLATAAVPSAGPATNCDSITFSIGGKRQWPLIDARTGKDYFAGRVERLLGVRFSAPRR